MPHGVDSPQIVRPAATAPHHADHFGFHRQAHMPARKNGANLIAFSAYHMDGWVNDRPMVTINNAATVPRFRHRAMPKAATIA